MTEIERLAIVMLQRGHSWDEIIYQTEKLIQKKRREKTVIHHTHSTQTHSD